MADQKIKIDIDIQSEALKQLPQYKKGFDELKVAINNLNNEIVTSTEKLSKMGEANKEASNFGTKLKNGIVDLAGTFTTLTGFLKTASLATGVWGKVIAGALTLVTTFGPQALDFLNKIFQSDKVREAARALESYNNIMASYKQNIAGGISEIEMLRNLAQNDKVFHKTRREALEKLIQLSPEHLKNLTLENIKTKEGKQLIDDYTKSLKQKNIQEAIADERSKYVKERLDLQKEYNEAKKVRNEYLTGKKENFVQGGHTINGTYQAPRNDMADSKIRFENAVKKDKELIRHVARLDKLLAVESIKNYVKPAVTPSSRKPVEDKSLASVHITQNIPKQLSTAPTEEEIRKESADRMALLTLEGFAREVEETNQHFAKLKKEHQNNHATVEQLEREHQAKLASITNKFQNEGLAKLASYSQELNKTSNDAHFDAIQQITAEYRVKAADIAKIQADNEKLARQAEEESLKLTISKLDITDKTKLTQIDAKIAALEKKRVDAQQVVDQAKLVATQLADKKTKDTTKVNTDFANDRKHETLEGDIAAAHSAGKWQQEFELKQELLNLDTKQAIDAAQGKESAIAQIRKEAKDKQDQLDRNRLDAEVANQKRYVQGVDKLAGAVTAIFGKNTVAARLAFKAHQAAAAAQVIIDTRQAIMGIWKANAGLPIIGVPKAIAETAIVVATGASNLATIVKQKPGFAQGGQYVSDGRGALLAGYSRTDNTNAYLRSGEAVVVSEAMRNPWARNLVSAINVAHGGRDFSIANPGSGYAVGGIFTDGGNASRYYSQPMNDQKDLANTLAYQMLNNFPPIYVDVKDVNNQQNILAQTVNRVTL